MSSEAIGWVFKHSPYKGAALCVHLALADSANDQNDNEIWARQSWIAEKAHVGRQRVNEVLSEMVSDGLLELVEDNSAARKPNRYRLVLPATEHVASGDMTCRPGRHEHVASGDTEPKREPKRNQNTPKPPRSDSEESAVDGGEFELFWQEYPRKASKAASRKAFWAAKRRGADLGRLLPGLSLWRKHWEFEQTPMKFVPHASTWLNQERYLEAPEVDDDYGYDSQPTVF